MVRVGLLHVFQECGFSCFQATITTYWLRAIFSKKIIQEKVLASQNTSLFSTRFHCRYWQGHSSTEGLSVFLKSKVHLRGKGVSPSHLILAGSLPETSWVSHQLPLSRAGACTVILCSPTTTSRLTESITSASETRLYCDNLLWPTAQLTAVLLQKPLMPPIQIQKALP